MALVIFPSITELYARLYPARTASFKEAPSLSSSPILSLMITFASTAIPKDRIMPAIPGSVSVYWGTDIAKSCRQVWNARPRQATKPGNRYFTTIKTQIRTNAPIPAATMISRAEAPREGLIVLKFRVAME